MRFAVSARDRALSPWWKNAERVEADVDVIDCLGQHAGGAVVQLSLFDGWLRFAVVHYRDASFIGRADDDTVINLSWLHAALAAEVARLAHESLSQRLVYAGTFQWFHWDEAVYMPRGWGMGPWNARRNAAREAPSLCGRCSYHSGCNASYMRRCAGPFPFATGPLLLLSSGLARWYERSDEVRRSVRGALQSRLNRSADSGQLTMVQARTRERFLQPADAGDLQVRVFDDVFLGHALCMRGVRNGIHNLTVLSFPYGTIVDVPCNGRGRRGTSGCRNGITKGHNWSAPNAPYVLHNVKMASEVEYAATRLNEVRFGTQLSVCKPIQLSQSLLACGHDWTWCATPWEAPRRRRVGGGKAVGGTQPPRARV